jgi:hypothetical protein
MLLEMNRSALQFRMKKLGIVQPGPREAKPPQLTAFDLGF